MSAKQKPTPWRTALTLASDIRTMALFLGLGGSLSVVTWGQNIVVWAAAPAIDQKIAESERRQEAKRAEDIHSAIAPIDRKLDVVIELISEMPEVKQQLARKAARDSLKQSIGGSR